MYCRQVLERAISLQVLAEGTLDTASSCSRCCCILHHFSVEHKSNFTLPKALLEFQLLSVNDCGGFEKTYLGGEPLAVQDCDSH